jgi:hypothetical protein
MSLGGLILRLFFAPCVISQEMHEPLQSCLRYNRDLRDLPAKTPETLQLLVSFGATWDAKCDELVFRGEAREEAPALRICLSLWTQERSHGLPVTEIPLEVIKRGAGSTQAYIDDRKSSTAVVLRL